MIRPFAAVLAIVVLATCTGAPSGGDRLYLRAGDAGHSVLVIDAESGALEREVSGALVAPDWSATYEVRADGASTVVSAIDPRTGGVLREGRLGGSYDVPHAYGPGPSGLSPKGRWLALAAPQRRDAGRVVSRFAILETATLTVAGTAELPGDFTFDAIAEDGRTLYLIEHPRPGVTVYLVRAWDIPKAEIFPGVIADPKQTVLVHGVLSAAQAQNVQLMNGVYHTSVPSADGAWLYSLYFSPTEGPFIHALNMTARNAFCILGLPRMAGEHEKRGMWTLAMAPGTTTLYATNAALGAVTEIDTVALKVKRVVRTPPLGAAGSIPGRFPAGGAAISRNGQQLYVVGEQGLLAIETRDLTVRGRFLMDRSLASLAVSAGGTRLYALDTDGTVWKVAATSGEILARVAHVDGAVALLRVE